MTSPDLWLKALHIVAVIAWMAGLLYLPRLFVYHALSPRGSATSQTFKIMERRLLRAIMTPACVVVWITGPMLTFRFGYFQSPWLHVKLLLVIILTGFHAYMFVIAQGFANDQNRRSSKFFRIINEIPTIIMIIAVILVVLKPF